MDFTSFANDLESMFQTECTILPTTVLNEQDWWDSMAYLYIITYAEENLNIDIEFDDIKSAKTAGELHSMLISVDLHK